MGSSEQSGEVLKHSDPRRFSQRQKAVAFPIQNLYSVSRFVEEHEKHRIKHRDLDVQFDQRGEASDGFSEVHGHGVEVDFFDFGVGSHHEVLAPEKIGSTASGIRGRL